MITSAALTAVEQLINQALRYDPASLRSLGELQGKIIAIESTFPPLAIFMHPHSAGIQLTLDADKPADTTLKGSALALATLLSGGAKSTLYGSGVEVNGDTSLLQSLSAMLRDLDIDWEAALAKLLGDVPAHLLGESVRAATKWQKATAERAAVVLSDFSVEEAQWLPPRAEFDAFTLQVADLRRTTDRLAARIDKLKQVLPNTNV